MKGVKKLTTVPAAFAAIGEKINEIIDANPPLRAGAGINISVSKLHTLISLEDPAATQGADPFTLIGFIDSGVAKINVTPGMVNNFVPTISVSGTPISIATVPAPSLVVTGTSGSVYLKATVDTAGAVTALVIESASSVPVDTSTAKHKLIGTWALSGGVFSSVIPILNANQTLYLCNGTAIWEA